ncbi:MAG TPA: 3'-5' exonuclease [Gemmatimonadaceae bacterium]|nr:3'-5' exonuclease [Gemmatimonadaceae bacterium]
MTQYAPPSSGFMTRPAESLLSERASDYLSAGPATAAALIATVCQLPAVPGPVAEHMAAALFAGRREFARGTDGLWRLATSLGTEPAPAPALLVREPAPVRTPDALDSLSYTVVDVETTGSSPERGHRITEIAAVRVENGEVRDVFQTLVNPERSIPPFITALTSISWEMVKDAPRFVDVCDELVARMEGTVFVAHNATFDWKFVAAEVARATGRRIEGRRLCTVRLARVILPQLRRKSLDWVANHYGVQIEGRHRAGGDALATAHCLLRMLKAARADHECATWEHLDRLAGNRTPRRRTRRPPAMPTPVTRDTTA